MPFKINLGTKDGKTFKIESDNEEITGKKIGESISGKDISEKLEGYEFEIMGTSDKAGFPGIKEIDGTALKKKLLTYGIAMKKKARKEGKKNKGNLKPNGLRLKKTVRGNTISKDTIQINLKDSKQGSKKLDEIFPEQVKKKEEKTEGSAEASAEKKEEKK